VHLGRLLLLLLLLVLLLVLVLLLRAPTGPRPLLVV